MDLSCVQWVDVGTVVQLVLFVERALRDGIDVEVVLPLKRKTEEEILKYTAQAARRERSRADRNLEDRVAAAGFLKYMQFREALHIQCHIHFEMRYFH